MDNKNSLPGKIKYFCFYAAVILEVSMVIVDKSALINPFEGWLFRITFVLCFITACLTKYTWKEYLFVGCLLGIAAISYFVTGRNDLLRIVMFLAACKSMDMKRCLKLVFWMTLMGCLLLMLLSITGVFGTLTRTMDYGRNGTETRYTIGIGHPNALQCMIFFLTSLGIYLYHKSLKWYAYMGIALVNTGFFFLTGSKAAFLSALLIIIPFLMSAWLKNEKIKKLAAAGSLLAVAGSIFVSVMAAKDAMCLWDYYFNGPKTGKVKVYLIINKLLTGRMDCLLETKRHEGIIETWSLFSSPGNNYYFDMGWVRVFYWYGIIPGIFIVTVLLLLIVYFYKKKMLPELILFAVFALYTIVEAHIISVYIARNYLLFVAGMYWCRLLQPWGNEE